MRTYIVDIKKIMGELVIEAEQMTRGDYYTYHGLQLPEKEIPETEGYRVRFMDGSETWQTKRLFETVYCPFHEGLSFGAAIELMKKGYRMQRKGWNGKNQYIELASAISYETAHGGKVECGHDAIGNSAVVFVGTSGVQMGWLASQADMLAEDWVVVMENSDEKTIKSK